MSCQLLERVHAYSPEKLIKMGFKFLPIRTLQSVFGTLHPSQHRMLKQQSRRGITLHRLADTLYYHQGATLSRLSRWNEMTKLQLQHELEKRGKLEEGEEKTLSEWKLRMRLVFIMTEEKRAWVEGVKGRLEKEQDARGSWLAQCRAYDEDDSDQPIALVEQEGSSACRA